MAGCGYVISGEGAVCRETSRWLEMVVNVSGNHVPYYTGEPFAAPPAATSCGAGHGSTAPHRVSHSGSIRGRGSCELFLASQRASLLASRPTRRCHALRLHGAGLILFRSVPIVCSPCSCLHRSCLHSCCCALRAAGKYHALRLHGGPQYGPSYGALTVDPHHGKEQAAMQIEAM